MPGKAAKITITEVQQQILRSCSRHTTASSRLRQRASIIALAFDGLLNQEIAEQVGLTHRQVGRWQRRWANAWNRLIDIECGETRAALRRAIQAVLGDQPRPGAPAKFTPEQVTRILALTCEPPEKSDRPITHWTAHELKFLDTPRRSPLYFDLTRSRDCSLRRILEVQGVKITHRASMDDDPTRADRHIPADSCLVAVSPSPPILNSWW